MEVGLDLRSGGTPGFLLFNGCHYFTAGALRAAGLPIRPWWAFNGWLIGLQLDRAKRLAEEVERG